MNERCRVVAGVSGRSTSDALRLVSIEDLVYHGNHGFEILRGDKVEVVSEAASYAASIERS